MASDKPASGKSSRRVKATGIPREKIDTEKLAIVYWLQARRQGRKQREKQDAAGQTPEEPTSNS